MDTFFIIIRIRTNKRVVIFLNNECCTTRILGKSNANDSPEANENRTWSKLVDRSTCAVITNDSSEIIVKSDPRGRS